jgi:hypothetical protein
MLNAFYDKIFNSKLTQCLFLFFFFFNPIPNVGCVLKTKFRNDLIVYDYIIPAHRGLDLSYALHASISVV